MIIQVYGSGCPTCKKLFEQTKQAVAELKLDIEVGYSDDIQKIVELGAMSSPALVINNRIVLAGQVPGAEKIKDIITKNTTENKEQKK
ncbi:MAG: thioredoxin family protein [Candidatus Falkowbacteria bacterium]|nr:thioredoxin family protein [Candidatus Falkowbacteria bacterium]